MSYPPSYVRYLNLPKIPGEIMAKINFNFEEYDRKSRYRNGGFWSDSFNEEINKWCQENVCDSIYYAFQVFPKDLHIHKDTGTKTKLIYLLQEGGSNVVTTWYDEDQTTVLQSVRIPLHTWVLFKADAFHGVTGVEEGMIRSAITGRVFE